MRTPKLGSGLRGLADRVAAVDGRRDIDSTPGRGASIRTTLPLAPAPYGYPHPLPELAERKYAWPPHRHTCELVGRYAVLNKPPKKQGGTSMHSTSIHSTLIDARIAELHRDAQRVVTPRIARADSNKIRRWTAALATCLKPTTRTIPVERHAI